MHELATRQAIELAPSPSRQQPRKPKLGSRSSTSHIFFNCTWYSSEVSDTIISCNAAFASSSCSERILEPFFLGNRFQRQILLAHDTISHNMSSPFRGSLRALKGLPRIQRSLLSSQKATTGGTVNQRPSQYPGVFRPSLSQFRRDPTDRRTKPPYNPQDYITISPWDPIHVVYLRDSCTCAKCVDPSSKQKNFQTTDIPEDIRARNLKIRPDDGTVEVVWENDIPGFESDHKSNFPREFFHIHSTPHAIHHSRFESKKPTLWNKKTISRELEYVEYDDYMNTDLGLYRGVQQVRFLFLTLKTADAWLNSCINMACCWYAAFLNPRNRLRI